MPLPCSDADVGKRRCVHMRKERAGMDKQKRETSIASILEDVDAVEDSMVDIFAWGDVEQKKFLMKFLRNLRFFLR
jgi:hypothetical protein